MQRIANFQLPIADYLTPENAVVTAPVLYRPQTAEALQQPTLMALTRISSWDRSSAIGTWQSPEAHVAKARKRSHNH